MEEKRIVVLDFCNGGVDIVTTTEDMIDEYGGEVENYLIDHCGYSLSNIQWLVDPKYISEMSHDDYEDGEGLEYRLQERFEEMYVKSALLSGSFDGNEIKPTCPISLKLLTPMKDLCERGSLAYLKVDGEDYKFFVEYENGKFNVSWGKLGSSSWNEIEDAELSIGFDVDDEPECDELLLNGDDDKPFNANFYDGFAIEMGDFGDDLSVMFYPTRKMVLASNRMKEEIALYTNRDDYTPYDIALKYGTQPKKMSEILTNKTI